MSDKKTEIISPKMAKGLIYFAIFFVVFTIMVYSISSLVEISLDIRSWEKETRLTAGLVWGFGCLSGGIFAGLFSSDI